MAGIFLKLLADALAAALVQVAVRWAVSWVTARLISPVGGTA